MLLNQRFYRLPIIVDAGLIESEVSSVSANQWIEHPQGYVGNSALTLVSVNGADNHDFFGQMALCPRTESMPYVKRVLASLNTSIGRSRLMRLAGGAHVPPHSDTNLYWRKRMRIHIPIVTNESVVFESGGQTQRMKAGEVWVMDTWHTHSVCNDGDERIHLVVDTRGSPEFWAMLKSQAWASSNEEQTPPDNFFMTHIVPYGETVKVPPSLLLESSSFQAVLHPNDVTEMIQDYCNDLALGNGHEWVSQATLILQSVGRQWTDIWASYGDSQQHHMRYRLVILHAIKQLKGMMPEPLLQTNRQPISRLLRPLITALHSTSSDVISVSEPVAPHVEVQKGSNKLVNNNEGCSGYEGKERMKFTPVFIVAAPRSGSTLLFETLSLHDSLVSYDSESHQLIESIPSLSIRANDSNELNASHAQSPIPEQLRRLFLDRLPQSDLALNTTAKFLEKTPKNALRVDFLKACFPNARFIYLHRQPQSNVSSIIEGWKSKRFVTYKNLQGWDSDYEWSFLLPSGWRALPRNDLAAVAAHQYVMANKLIIKSLTDGSINRNAMALAYEDFVQNTNSCLQRICQFLELPWSENFDCVLNTSKDLPLSKYTLTQPSSDKWRENEAVMQQGLPELQKYYQDEICNAAERINIEALTISK